MKAHQRRGQRRARALRQPPVGRRLPRDADARCERQAAASTAVRRRAHRRRARDADRREREQTAEDPTGSDRDDTGRAESRSDRARGRAPSAGHHADGEQRDAEHPRRESLGGDGERAAGAPEQHPERDRLLPDAVAESRHSSSGRGETDDHDRERQEAHREGDEAGDDPIVDTHSEHSVDPRLDRRHHPDRHRTAQCHRGGKSTGLWHLSTLPEPVGALVPADVGARRYAGGMCASYGLDPRFTDAELLAAADDAVLEGLRVWARENAGETVAPRARTCATSIPWSCSPTPRRPWSPRGGASS